MSTKPIMMTVVCKKEDMKKLEEIIFRETTTIGIRYRKAIASKNNIPLKEIYNL